MSTQTKSGGGGGRKSNKTANSNSTHADTNNKKVVSDHNKTEKEKPQIKPTAEQIRIAQITDIKSNVEDPKIREKVDQLMETTQRSEEDVCYALYECDNDVEKAVIYLLETLEVGAFATTSKKKKNRSTAAASTNDAAGATIGGEEWDDMTNNNNTSVSLNSNNNTNSNNNIGDNRDRSRGRGGMRGSGGSRGGRMGPRDNNNHDARMDKGENRGDNTWRGGRTGNSRGSSRGGFGGSRGGGRGGRMGGLGPRSQNNYRDNHRNNYRNNQEIDSWDSSQINSDIITNKSEDTWGDWDNEEYTGSLSDTKVFTPSSATNQGSVSNPSDLSAPPGLEQQILNQQTSQNDVQQYSTTVSSGTSASGVNNNVQYPELHSASTAAQHLRQALEKTMPQLSQTTSLSAEQSQYFNTLSSQNSNVNSYQTSSVQYQYGDHQVSASQAPAAVARRQQRVRVPPPSKIPSSAVEMPGDLNSMGFLDVQFGGLEFGTEESIDNVADKFSATSIDGSHGAHQANDDYQSKLTNTGVSKPSQSSLAGGLQQTSLMQNADSMTSTQNDNLTSSYATSRSNTSNVMNNSGSNLDPLVKSDPYSQSSNQSSASYQNMSYSTSNKPSSYQPSSGPGVYNNNSYNSSQQQVSSTNSYPPSSNTYNSYNQSSYQQSQQTQNNQQQTQPSQNSQQPMSQSSLSSLSSASSVVVNNANVVGVSGNTSNPNIPVNSAGANSSANSNYLSNQYSVSQTSGYPSQQSYQTNQSVYGNSGLNNNTGSSSNSVSSGVTSAVSNNSAITTSSISSPSSLGLTNTKATTNSSMKSGTGNNATSGSGSGANNNVVQNIPVVSQFIQTTGVPFYQQQYVQYEDIQLVPPRMTHMPGYYDLSNVNYPTPPTSLGAAGVRDGATGNLATVAYSTMTTDGRFTRTDNNSSPVSNVPSTISQQSGSAGGPMLNIPPYTTVPYYFGANMMAGGFQQAYPQIYPQQMATNPNSGGQYAKPSFYSSGSTGYDTIGQTPQDYNKTASIYPSGGVSQQQAKGQSVSNQSGGNSDIASSMYSSKSHVALNKVNSYDKQSFHSGTPPPFNLAGSQTAGSQTQAYGQHLFIPAAITAHHIHQPMHQIDGSGRLANSRRDTNNSGQRQQCTSQSKAQSKSGYSQSYWATQN